MNPKLRDIADKIQNVELRNKVTDFLDNPLFVLNGKVYCGPSFDVSPGGLAYHHKYEGGFIEHIRGSANLAFALCDVVEQIYGGKVNRDFVAAGILLHDIFKPATYEVNKNGDFVSSQLADYLDHIALVTSELVRRDFPAELIHIVAAHYGKHGTTKPKTIEALICHLADDVDSQLNGQILNAAEKLIQKATSEHLHMLTSKEAFEIIHAKATKGWDGLQKTVQKLKQERTAQT